jgi:hypothetical protein
MSAFNWEDFQLRVADYIEGGMDRASAELQVQHEMQDEQIEYEEWARDMELAPDLDSMEIYYGA